MDINYPAYKFWFDAIQTIALILLWIYSGFRSTNKKQDARITAVEQLTANCPRHTDQTDRNTLRIEKIELDINKLPDRQELNRLDDSIKNLNTKLGELSGSLKGINRAVDLINDHLINK